MKLFESWVEHGSVLSAEYRAHYALLFALVVIVFSFSLQNTFVAGDDYSFVRDNPVLAIPLSQIPSLFSDSVPSPAGLPPSNYYRPMLMLLHIVAYRIWGVSSVGFHLTNIILHAVGSIFLFKAGLILFGKDWRKALLGAALFAVHPVHNQTVGAVGLGDALYGTLLILTLFFFLSRQRIASCVTFLLALFTKETSVVFPIALMVLAVHDRGLRRAAVEIAPYVAAAGIYLAARSLVVSVIPRVPGPELLSHHLLTMLSVTFDYVRLLAFPYPLQPYYPARWYVSALDPKVIVAFLVFAIALAIVYMKRKDTTTVFLFAATSLTLLPVIVMVNTFPYGDEYAYLAERYLYVPSMFFSLFAASVIVWLFKKSDTRILFFAGICLVSLFAVLTVYSCRVWKNSITLYGKVITDYPETAIAHASLGYAYEEAGQSAEAEREYKIAADLLYSKGSGLLEKGLCMQAVPKFVNAIEINPGVAEVYHKLGNAYMNLNLPNDAISNYLLAIGLSPGNAEVHYDLGVAYEKKSRLAEAIAEYGIASDLAPDLVRGRQQAAVPAGITPCRD